MTAKQVPPEEGGPGWWLDTALDPTAAPQPYDKDRDLAEANTRRLALADEVGRLRGTIRRALTEAEGIERVSPAGARVARVLREALGEEAE